MGGGLLMGSRLIGVPLYWYRRYISIIIIITIIIIMIIIIQNVNKVLLLLLLFLILLLLLLLLLFHFGRQFELEKVLSQMNKTNKRRSDMKCYAFETSPVHELSLLPTI